MITHPKQSTGVLVASKCNECGTFGALEKRKITFKKHAGNSNTMQIEEAEEECDMAKISEKNTRNRLR